MGLRQKAQREKRRQQRPAQPFARGGQQAQQPRGAQHAHSQRQPPGQQAPRALRAEHVLVAENRTQHDDGEQQRDERPSARLSIAGFGAAVGPCRLDQRLHHIAPHFANTTTFGMTLSANTSYVIA